MINLKVYRVLFLQIHETTKALTEIGPKVKVQKMDDTKKMYKINKMVLVGIFLFCNSFQIFNYFLKNKVVESIADFFLTFNASINVIVQASKSTQTKYKEILLSIVPKCGVSHSDSVINRLPKFWSYVCGIKWLVWKQNEKIFLRFRNDEK